MSIRAPHERSTVFERLSHLDPGGLTEREIALLNDIVDRELNSTRGTIGIERRKYTLRKGAERSPGTEKLRARVADMRSQEEQVLRRKVRFLEEEVRDLRKEKSALQEKLEELEDENEDLKEDKTELKFELKKYKKKQKHKKRD